MVDRISGGKTTPLQQGQGIGKARGAQATKTEALKQRQATREGGAQLRAHKQERSAKTKTGQSFFQRHFGRKPSSPQQVRQQERAQRHQRLQQQGSALAQHKKDYAQARTEHERYTQEKKTTQETDANKRTTTEPRQEAGGKGTLTARGEGKQEQVEVTAFKFDQHGMRDRMGALDAFTKLRGEGRSVRFVEPKSTLPQRSALLHEGRRSFFGQAGAKFKDLMLRMFRPQKWQRRQVALSDARKAEFAYIKRNEERLVAQTREKDMQILETHKQMEAIHKRSLEDSVEKPPQAVPRHLAQKLTDKSDPELLKNPDYVRERVQLLEEIAQKRVETESAAIAKTREKLEAQTRAAKQQPQTDPLQPQPTAAPRAAPRQSTQTDL